jgi:hypothetical protein
MPLFYLFWRAEAGDVASSGGVWALLLGSVVALVQFFLGSLVYPGGFGLSRWVSACIDIVSLPVVLPLLVYLLFIFLRVFSGNADFTNFALLWLIPSAAIRAVNWGALNDPTLLVLVPLLWTAITVGIPFFIRLMIGGKRLVFWGAVLGILGLPFIAATTYWAFYSQKIFLGFLFFFITVIPVGISTVISSFKTAG